MISKFFREMVAACFLQLSAMNRPNSQTVMGNACQSACLSQSILPR